MARIVLTTLGTYGDIYPYLGLALALKARGHTPALAATSCYRDLVEGENIAFHPLRPYVDMQDTALLQRLMDPLRGGERGVREILMPNLRDTYADLRAAVRGADLLVTHPLTYAAPILAQAQKIPWVSTVHAPMWFVSALDPSALPFAPRLIHLRRLGAWTGKLAVAFTRFATRTWSEPVYALRKDLGLSRGGNPMFEGQFSPHRTLALFSPLMAKPQPDWPANAECTGFVFYNGPTRMSVRLQEFLAAGSAPIVFTLGTSAVYTAKHFYRESVEAVSHLGMRAVLLIGAYEGNRFSKPLPSDVLAIETAPHHELFPWATAIVHHGGIGTTGQALRSGRPMLVVPHAHDQPDNAYRATRLGVARTLFPGQYRAKRVARELRTLLDEPAYSHRAADLGRIVRSEDGIGRACQALERVLAS